MVWYDCGQGKGRRICSKSLIWYKLVFTLCKCNIKRQREFGIIICRTLDYMKWENDIIGESFD